MFVELVSLIGTHLRKWWNDFIFCHPIHLMQGNIPGTAILNQDVSKFSKILGSQRTNGRWVLRKHS